MKHKRLKAFIDFMLSEKSAPSHLHSSILAKVAKDLEPSFASAFQRFFLSLSVAGVATLFVCPQFGSGFVSDSSSHFIHSVMAYGPWACAAFCAFVFMGFASLVSAFAISQADSLVLYKKAWVTVGLPPLVYVSIFVVMRNKDAMHADFFVSPAYLLTWYVVAAVILAATVSIKKYRKSSFV